MFFPLFFGLIMALFLGIMIYTWHEAKAANPVILDERGHVRQ
ncbi:MAG: hypothetical protein SFV54_16580 [Bryobacteraceae bacterium]|nr:hypothetical protein [Bryobacteraceae bacterium]